MSKPDSIAPKAQVYHCPVEWVWFMPEDMGLECWSCGEVSRGAVRAGMGMIQCPACGTNINPTNEVLARLAGVAMAGRMAATND